MLSINQKLNLPQTRFVKEQQLTQNSRKEAPNYSHNSYDKGLLALAAIGLATLTSCSSDSYLGIDTEEIVKETKSAAPIRKTDPMTNKNTVERTDTILHSLGIIDENTSIKDIETLCNIDDTGVQHYTKPTGLYGSIIHGQGMSLLKDSSAGEIYTFRVSNAANGGLNVTKNYNDGTEENLNYVLNDDKSVTEYSVLDKNFMVEKSTFSKNNDGVLERKFADGTILTYPITETEFPYPAAITFSATVTDYQDVHANM